ncbi:MAG: hypothetical protein KGL39_43405 [Patescibacteria group bacterium]|nr:hypothetical protein [Patescibacteria group bacterium]
MTKRDATIAKAQSAGYHDDRRAFTRNAIEGRVQLPTLQKAWERGQQQRRAGVLCSCWECSQRERQA